ncbi:hypothetical protein C3943_12555 [Lysinibacillus sp. B2A1]|nr:hypothetical protein C3943_12555 [Lysinibacillus sp. B2A1]
MTPWGFSVTDETLERAMRVKRLIGRPQESTQSERRSTPRFEKGLYFLICHLDFIDIIVFQQHAMKPNPRFHLFINIILI